MAEKKITTPPSPKADAQEPAEIAFDFENLIAAAVAAVILKKSRKRRIIVTGRDSH
jgi:hypothetical protein